jgi:hypothetical protein
MVVRGLLILLFHLIVRNVPKDRKILMDGPFEFRLNHESKITENLIFSGIESRFCKNGV